MNTERCGWTQTCGLPQNDHAHTDPKDMHPGLYRHAFTPTDPTPRTAATAREALIEKCADAVWNAGHYTFGADLDDLIALAAAEAPGRVSALEAAGMRAARDAHAAWLRAGIGQHTPTLIEECPNEWCREHVAALAAPASPAGVSGEVCLGCGEPEEPRRIPCCSNCSCPIPFAPAPTPSEPVARCGFTTDGFRCNDTPLQHRYLCGLLHSHTFVCHPFTSGARDE